MTIPTSPGRLIGIACLIAAALKMTGVVAVKFGAPELLLFGLLAAAVIP